jgi:uracil-DNA glycosylase family 4
MVGMRAGGAIGPHGPGRPGGPRVRLVPGALEVAETAAGCASWDELVGAARRCTACPELAATRTTVVVGDIPAGRAGPGGRAGSGNRGGPLLALVGEAPGAEEDRSGRPFVGRAGRLLDELLAEAGLARPEVAVLNVLQCRPPGNRTPAPDEVARCRGWLLRKLELLRPDVVCALGLTAATWFLGRGVKLATARGQLHEVDGRPVVVSYHPSAAIRYGPAGAPLAALRADLRLAADVLRKSTEDDTDDTNGTDSTDSTMRTVQQ